MLLGVDLGTTRCKAGLVDEAGRVLTAASRPTPVERSSAGYAFYDPERLWGTVASAIHEALASAKGAPVRAIGVASMAETGLLVDRDSGTPRSELIPWFDSSAAALTAELTRHDSAFERFARTGIYPSFKCSLAKLLWLRRRQSEQFAGAIWLSAADYVAFRLCGRMGTDYSLAGRTYAFDIAAKVWDAPYLEALKLSACLFPPAHAAGTVLGEVMPSAASTTGLPGGTPVCVAGHDHLCAALAGGALTPGCIFNSMGTAETLVGARPPTALGAAEHASGLSFGCHVLPGHGYWMGGLSASGGSLEWLRGLLRRPPLTYAELEAMVDSDGAPGEVLYFPYLAGSGAPHTDPRARGGFVGLTLAHGPADLVRAVLEGTAYEVETMRRAAERVVGQPIKDIRASGGGTRNRPWLQIKADVMDCRLEVLAEAEGALLGAALLAGLGTGIQSQDNWPASRPAIQATISPREERHALYRQHYERGYLPLQAPLRQYGRLLAVGN